MTMHPALVAAGTAVARAVCVLLGGREVAVREFLFLAEYLDDPDVDAPYPAIDRTIAAAGLGAEARALLLIVALVEEDARFGVLFEALQISPGQHRPTLGLLVRMLPTARVAARALVRAGLLRVHNPEAPGSDAVLEVPGPLWEALADGVAPAWTRFRGPSELRELAALHLAPELAQRLLRLPPEPATLLVRGPRRNGRGTILGALARGQGLGALEVELPADDPRLAIAGPLATALDAMLILRLDPGHGQAARLPWPSAYDRHLGVVMPREGGLDGEIAGRTLAFRREMPGLPLRAAQWAEALPEGNHRSFAATFRLTSGGIAQAAALARTQALARGEAPTLGDVREATRALHREVLDQLATPLTGGGAWNDLVVSGEVERELRQLERRCVRREALPQAVGPALRALSPGVRALFAGPSGTGKTLAARTLAGVLGMDIYRLDLSAVVNKYIGETEKNLERVFAHAEELDVVLLLDEGDALMSRRTAVSSANDRYANLETNFLLQRLESFDGIVIVTTNAAERIDPAFARRMDVVVEFTLPDIADRARLWARHLPEHAVSPAVMDDIAELCPWTGAQIRNAAIHAALLALDGDRQPAAADLLAAIDREHRKLGAPSPFGGK